MNLFERTLLTFLRNSKIKLEVTGFDMDGFHKAMRQVLRDRLDAIECIAFEDSDLMSDAQKVAAIKLCFEEEFCP